MKPSPGRHADIEAQNPPTQRQGIFRRIVSLYTDGFRSMTVGRSLWILILIKLAIIFLVFKLFFFPDLLATRFDNDADRAAAVRHSLTEPR